MQIENPSHSEEYFTEDRNYWFNEDFFALMAHRWQLQQYSAILDIGSGLCHWSKLLVRYMKAPISLTAYDNDAKWSKGNDDLVAYFKKHQISVDFVQGNAHKLPFADNSFDVVTCQTLLIHVKNPLVVLEEMKRVVKPNGIVICSEPNNRIQALLQDSLNANDDIPSIVKRVKQNLAEEKWKAYQQQGNSSFGDLLTSSFNDLGFKNIKSYLNDKLLSIYPPYKTLEQQAKINSFLKWGKTPTEIQNFDNNYAKSVQSNEDYVDFLNNPNAAIHSNNPIVNDIKKQHYSNSGATLLYLVSGQK